MDSRIDRRKFIETTLLVIGGMALPGVTYGKCHTKPVRFGIVTDIHYADKNPPKGSKRYYKQSLGKLRECIEVMNSEKVDFLIELGDFKDEGTPPNESETLQYLKTIENEFQKFNGANYHVLGNHDMDSISKKQFLDNISNEGFDKAEGYYSFDVGSLHFVVLDANFREDGSDYSKGNYDWKDANIPPKQLGWLKNDLAVNDKPTIVFIHHQLDSSAMENTVHCPKNADEVRQILENSGNVLGVFQGHNHAGYFSEINDIFYYTLKSVVEGKGSKNNNYAIVEIDEKLNVSIKGYRRTRKKSFLRD
jgi:predicted phosphodiesterase